ncbi:MAG: restriction endonuclease subunit S [Comamonas sp.]
MSLPNSWVMTPLNNLLDQIVGGGTPSKSIAANFIGAVPFMTVKDMKARFIADTVDHISEEAVASSATTKIPADTLVVATRMSLGKIVRPSVEVAINQDLKALFPSAGINKTYIEYFWRSKSDFIQSKGTGTTVKGIRIEDIKNLEVNLAPENEQRRIADKLDTTLARVDALNDRLARITPLLKRFRQSVLAAATSGRLTEGSYSETSLFSEKLKNVCEIFSGYAFKKSQYSDSGSKLLQIANVSYGKVIWDEVAYIPIDLAKLEFDKFSLKVGDIVLALNRPITNSQLKISMVKAFDLPATLYQRVARFRCENIKIDKEYLYIYLQSPKFFNFVKSNLQGSDQPYINTSSVGDFELEIPAIEEQIEIVRRVETLFAFADRLEARLRSAQTAAERLTPALLAKAFRGELVPQDPSDEPATELLRRLREARAAQVPTKRPRKTTTTRA